MTITTPDIFLPSTYARDVPFETFRHLRAHDPVSWIPEPAVGAWSAGPGYWAVVRYADVKQVLHDHATYSSFLGGAQLRDPDTPEDLGFLRSMIVNQDPPGHGRLRRIVSGSFAPRAIRDLSAAIEERAAQLIDEVVARGTADFAELAADLPVWTLGHALGMPEQDFPLLRDWTDRVIGYQDAEYADGIAIDQNRLSDLGRASYAIRRDPGIRGDGSPANPRSRGALADIFHYAHTLAESPTPGSLLAAMLDGGLDGDEFELMFFGLVLAGTATLRASAPGGLHSLLSNTGEYRKLREDPALIDSAVEEMLRYWSPGIMLRRTCARDTELAGRELRRGEKVGVYMVSANRDEAVFTDPDRFDITRSPNEHIGFGHGPHYCGGAHIARLELKAIIGQAVARLPGLELAGPPVRMTSNFVNGLKHLPVRWNTTAAFGTPSA